MFDKYLEEFIEQQEVEVGFDDEINLWYAWTGVNTPVGLTAAGETETEALEKLAAIYVVYKSLNSIANQ